ncbi:hypothetical protein [Plebeiibacterium marinum]|uniref:Uncharacterized protein n=1 Tax=Plebeiibacterium marinum TaxID=2992111 RepID=A0AAE3SK47_9BACT|nr:hypothetical protein [Plebeiobacterium marinum]MCW3806242.1 hypothetical protein [Plebeiobacterium marinum]
MNLNFTQNIKTIEEYSLSLLDLFDELPDSVFEDERLSPSKKVMGNIIKHLRGNDQSLTDDSRLQRYNFN